MEPEYTTIVSSDEGDDGWDGQSEEEAEDTWNSMDDDDDMSSRSVSDDDADGDAPHAHLSGATEEVASRRSRVPVPRCVADACSQSELMEDDASASFLHECMTSLLASVGGAHLLHDAQRRVGLQRSRDANKSGRAESEAIRTMWKHLSSLRPASSADTHQVDFKNGDGSLPRDECTRVDVRGDLQSIVAAMRQLCTPKEGSGSSRAGAAVQEDDARHHVDVVASQLDALRGLFEGLAQHVSLASAPSVVADDVPLERRSEVAAAPAAEPPGNDVVSAELAALRDATVTVTEICRKEAVGSFRPLYDELLYLRQCVSTNRVEEQVLWAINAFAAQNRLLEIELKHVENDRRALLGVCRAASCSEESSDVAALASLEARLARLCDIGKQLRLEQVQLRHDLRAMPAMGTANRPSTTMAGVGTQHGLLSTMMNESSDLKRQVADLNAKLREAEVRAAAAEQGAVPSQSACSTPLLLEKLERSMSTARTTELQMLRQTMGALIGRPILAVHTPLAGVGDVIVEVEELDRQTRHIRIPIQQGTACCQNVLDDTVAVPLAQALVTYHAAAVKQREEERERLAEALKRHEASLAFLMQEEQNARHVLLQCEEEEGSSLVAASAAVVDAAAHASRSSVLMGLDNPFADEEENVDEDGVGNGVADDAETKRATPSGLPLSASGTVDGQPVSDGPIECLDAQALMEAAPQPSVQSAPEPPADQPESPVPTASSAAATESKFLEGFSKKRSRSPSPTVRTASPRLERQPTNTSMPVDEAAPVAFCVSSPSRPGTQEHAAPEVVLSATVDDQAHSIDGDVGHVSDAAHNSPPQPTNDNLFAEDGFWA